MGYQRRPASFSFMGAVSIGKSVDVVQDREEHPVLASRRLPILESVGGTVAMSLAEFVQGRSLRPPTCRMAY